MRERLAALHERVGATRRRLEELVRRLAAARARLAVGGEVGEGSGEPGSADPRVFDQRWAIDDRELHFQALDTEDPKQDPKREER